MTGMENQTAAQEATGKRWYVLRASSGKEKKAKESIEGEVAKRNWQEFVPQVLIPTEKVATIRNGKKVIKDRNFFPGYVLLEADLRDEMIPIIQGLPNVIDFLREKDGKPTAMRPAEANRILGKIDDQVGVDAEGNERFILGETVKVVDGPVNSFGGVVEEINEEKKRLTVTVKIFGRKTPVELSFSQVSKE